MGPGMSFPGHVPGLAGEAVDGLQVAPVGYSAACAVGLGGHLTVTLKKASPFGKL